MKQIVFADETAVSRAQGEPGVVPYGVASRASTKLMTVLPPATAMRSEIMRDL